MSESALDLRDVEVCYSEKTAILSLTALAVNRGERVAVIGPSGCGKTTLLRFINGYVPGTAGRTEILGCSFASSANPIPMRGDRKMRRRVGFVFQSFNLVERATVFENVLWGRLGRVGRLASLLRRFSETDRTAAIAAIEEVGLARKASRRIGELSGGQQQRVGVARVLAQEAELILADEPVSNLDPRLAEDVLELLVEVTNHHGATLLMALHQPQLACRHAERIIGLRQGRVVWDGPSTQLDNRAVTKVYGSKGPPEELG